MLAKIIVGNQVVENRNGEIVVNQIDGELVVSSRQVAEDFGKKHKHVLEAIENIKAQNSAVTKMFIESSYKAGTGKNYKEYLLTRDGFSLLVMGFTGPEALEWKLKYIEAFNNMESYIKEQNRVPKNFAEALRLAAKLEEEKERLVLENSEMRPKAEFYDDVAGSKDAISIGEVAKVLGIKGIGRNNLFKLLRDKKILQSNNQPYQEYIDRGYFRVIEQRWTTTNGDTKISIKTLVYQKGLDFSSQM